MLYTCIYVIIRYDIYFVYMKKSTYKLKYIRYEKWAFPECQFEKYHNENKEKLGINGMRIVEEKLKKNGYTLKDISDRSGDDILAQKM